MPEATCERQRAHRSYGFYHRLKKVIQVGFSRLFGRKSIWLVAVRMAFGFLSIGTFQGLTDNRAELGCKVVSRRIGDTYVLSAPRGMVHVLLTFLWHYQEEKLDAKRQDLALWVGSFQVSQP